MVPTRAHILCWHKVLRFYRELIIYMYKGVLIIIIVGKKGRTQSKWQKCLVVELEKGKNKIIWKIKKCRESQINDRRCKSVIDDSYPLIVGYNGKGKNNWEREWQCNHNKHSWASFLAIGFMEIVYSFSSLRIQIFFTPSHKT